MRLQLRDNLPFISIEIKQRGRKVKIPNVLVDTGSGGTILTAEILSKIGIVPQPGDALHTIYGIGGRKLSSRTKWPK